MSDKHSAASKARWVGVSPEDRSAIMKAKINLRWSKATPEERAAQAQKMLQGRNKNK